MPVIIVFCFGVFFGIVYVSLSLVPRKSASDEQLKIQAASLRVMRW